jgi:hypothetical protein
MLVLEHLNFLIFLPCHSQRNPCHFYALHSASMQLIYYYIDPVPR